MRPVLFSSTTTVPCTVGRTRSSARALPFPLPPSYRLAHPHKDDVIECELALCRRIVSATGQHAAVGEPHAPSLPFCLSCRRLLDDHRRRPVHVVKRQPRLRERLLPSGALLAALRPASMRFTACARLASGPPNCCGPHCARIATSPPAAFPRGALQRRAYGRVHRV